jgi:hypothetical protein
VKIRSRAPHIHGELLKPHTEIGETSVSKYLVPAAQAAVGKSGAPF